jgi:hypothetical protein
MATTTNYGWTTPDDTALVKDGASAIRTLGTSVDTTTKNLNPSTTLGDIEYRSSTANVNTRLPLGTAGQVLKVNSGATAPEWATDASGMTNPMTTTGDTIYSSSGSTPARLAIGSTGNVLTVAGGVPTWAAPAGGGKVLQVLQDDLVGAIQSSSSTFTDTGLTITITPSSASSKILVMSVCNGCTKLTGNTALGIRLVRNSTTISNAGDGNGWDNSTGYNTWSSASITYLDSPATTSATTYKIQYSSTSNIASVKINDYLNTNDTTSTITVMEIGA